MTRTRLTRAVLFLCALATIAILIRSAQSAREARKAAIAEQQQHERSEQEQRQTQASQAKAAAQQAAKDAATAQAQFVARYVNTGFKRTPSLQTIAVAATSEGNQFDYAVADAVAAHFKSPAVRIVTSFFKPDVASEGLFDRLMGDSGDLISRLELTNSLDAMVLAKVNVHYSTDGAALDNMITANMQEDVMAVPIAPGAAGQSWTYTAKGAGFTREDARKLAEDRLIKQIQRDASISLSRILPTNPNQ